MSNLKIVVSNGEASLSGFIDETADLSPLSAVNGPLVINFKGVTRVNSCGVREWVNGLAKINRPEVHYKECSVVVVKQLNAVPDFQGKAKVDSFYAPYFCEDCDQESTGLLQSQTIQGDAPEVKCPSCQKPMNLDAIPSQYFGFLKRAA